MMDTTEFWIAPLLLVPGVGLLILSTSARFGRLHDEFHALQAKGTTVALEHLLTRAKLLKNALVALYSSISILALSSLFGSAAYAYLEAASWIAESIMTMGIVSLAYASILLVRESVHLFEIFQLEPKEKSVDKKK